MLQFCKNVPSSFDKISSISLVWILSKAYHCSGLSQYVKTFVLQKGKIVIIFTHGYQPNRKKSLTSRPMARVKEHEHQRTARARADQKKAKISRYFVDAVDEQAKIIYEFNDCVFHGHPECAEKENQVPFGDLTMKEAYERWKEQRDYLERRGYKVEVKWSCDWLDDDKDLDIKQFLQNKSLRESFCARDVFFWGRTNASRLYYEVSGDEQIHITTLLDSIQMLSRTTFTNWSSKNGPGQL